MLIFAMLNVIVMNAILLNVMAATTHKKFYFMPFISFLVQDTELLKH